MPDISHQQVQKTNTPSSLCPLIVANRKSYLVNDCLIYCKIWLKVKLDQLKSVRKITCTAFFTTFICSLLPPIHINSTYYINILNPFKHWLKITHITSEVQYGHYVSQFNWNVNKTCNRFEYCSKSLVYPLGSHYWLHSHEELNKKRN